MDGDRDSPKRQQMVEAILRNTAGLAHVIVAGDTNAKATNPAIARLSPPLVSVFGTSLTSTFNMRRKDNPGYGSAAVDMIFISPDLELVSRDCPSVDVSDHLPLIAEIKMLTSKTQ